MRNARLARSWIDNAPAWTRAVREGLIGSRRAGTDAAIVAACNVVGPDAMLDVGCGEGWLVRALCEQGVPAQGVDASAPLIDAARTGRGQFHCHGYDELVANSQLLPGPWPLIVCNFALLADPLAPLLAALATRLDRAGTLLIQAVHPWAAAQGDYRCGWREETFDGFGVPFAATMPWYFRTLESWFAEIGAAGLRVIALDEPRDCATGSVLSVLLTCRR